jgi:ketosteroid isomerase-like protein
VLCQAGSSFLIDRLKDLLSDGNDAQRVCDVASAILRASAASDFHTTLSHAADDLVHIALTLQRLPQTRSSGLQLFEDLMEMDVYSVATTLGELDRRLPYGQS